MKGLLVVCGSTGKQFDKTQLLPFRKAYRNPEDIQDEERASEGEPADDGPQLCNFFWCGSALQDQRAVNKGLPVEERQYTCVAGVMPWEGRGEWRRGVSDGIRNHSCPADVLGFKKHTRAKEGSTQTWEERGSKHCHSLQVSFRVRSVQYLRMNDVLAKQLLLQLSPLLWGWRRITSLL